MFTEIYQKFYHLQMLYFQFEGSDEEVETAFIRINQEGVAFTPIFNKVSEQSILKL